MNEKNSGIVIGIIVIIFLLAVLYFHFNAGNKSISKDRVRAESGSHLHMGTFARVVAVASDSALAEDCVEAALKEIEVVEELMSRTIDSSEVSRINRDADKSPVVVSGPTFEVLQKALLLIHSHF